MNIKDNIKSHFDSFGAKKIDVPEWQTTIYAKPLTLAELKKIRHLANDSDVELMVYCIIYKCLDADMNKIFSIGDKDFLMNEAKLDVLQKVSEQIMQTANLEEDAKK
jgi:hypothetical protein|tara:strand:- start:3213 stop:3533 length:321 start_codon:yes stop_codon:yes gene_type:complete